ncbi:hypothetical protein DFQ05_2050 [Winogradskyella wandonensis]|uniref:Anti-sigma factor n=1 Tax=Winogradskyella wandonensis TaxID=1442586 RepID=A0A4R1KNZ7_9FLAO|nr:hypothetical protein [Winogradskyella wandonensis]TCK66776.1 hypothetical protein DFQ05_2050 [Winogradskyella wandonensis]
MKRDIRELFKNEVEDTKHELPRNHREEFLAKLNSEKSNESNKSNYLFLRIAAVVVIALTVGFFTLQKPEAEENPLVAQVAQVEKEYLANIETEWQNFKAIATDSVLVKRYEKRLLDLDEDYKEISIAFKNDTNNIAVVEMLIQNLQTRLQLLKDIQEHIKILNQKPRTL